MPTLASLGLEVKSGDTVVAVQRLDGLTASAAKAEAATTRLGATSSRAMSVTSAAMTRAAGDTRQLAFQLNDIGVSLAGGQSPLMVLTQQGAQIAQLYAGNGGVGAALRDTASLVGGLVGKVWPLAAAGAALWGAWELVSYHMRNGAGSISDATRALAEQASPVDSLKSKMGELQTIVDVYAKAITATGDAQNMATASIIANSEREFNAKKSLLELELKRQEAAQAVQRQEIANTSLAMKREIGKATPAAGMDLLGISGSYSDPKIGQFVRAPYQDPLLERTQQIIDSSALGDKMKQMRAELELSEIATSQLQKVLGTTFDDASEKSITALVNKSTKATKSLADGMDAVDLGMSRVMKTAVDLGETIRGTLPADKQKPMMEIIIEKLKEDRPTDAPDRYDVVLIEAIRDVVGFDVDAPTPPKRPRRWSPAVTTGGKKG